MRGNEKERQELSTLKIKADAANIRMNDFQQDIATAITDIAFKQFTEFKEMDSKEILDFGNILSVHLWELTQALSDLHYRVRNNV